MKVYGRQRVEDERFSRREGRVLTARTSSPLQCVLGGFLVASAVHGGLFAAGACGFLGADATVRAAAAGCWFDHRGDCNSECKE